MSATTTLNETVRSPIDGSEAIRLATAGANWRATIDDILSARVFNRANTWASTQTFSVAPVFTDASGTRTALGLGALATASLVTSALLHSNVFSTAHSWSGQQTFTAPILGVATGTSLALGGATIGTDALGVTGTASISGNVGIGIASSASYLLLASSAGQFTANIHVKNTNADNFAILSVENSTGAIGQFVLSGNTNGFVTATYGTNQMTFEANGLGGMGFLSSNATAASQYFKWMTGANAATGIAYTTIPGNAIWQFGTVDAAAPVAQTIRGQSVIAGTSNTAGTNITWQAPAGTGTGAGGSHIFQVAPAGGTGTAQNAWATALTIDSAKAAFFESTIQARAQVSNSIPFSAIAAGLSAGEYLQQIIGNAASTGNAAALIYIHQAAADSTNATLLGLYGQESHILLEKGGNSYFGNAAASAKTAPTLTLTAAKSVVLNSAALATTATDGFLYIPTCAGTPTGVPTAYTGRVALVYDTTNDQFWIYDGAWMQPKTPAGAALVTWQ